MAASATSQMIPPVQRSQGIRVLRTGLELEDRASGLDRCRAEARELPHRRGRLAPVQGSVEAIDESLSRRAQAGRADLAGELAKRVEQQDAENQSQDDDAEPAPVTESAYHGDQASPLR